MKIAIASGKGGTGKTMISVSLALAARENVIYVDCDVEEPNGHIFLQPEITLRKQIYLSTPSVNEDQCTYCGKCRDICHFNAITVFGKTIMSFPELCHACGGCFLVCPEDALIRDQRLIGVLEKGHAGKIEFIQGILRVGEAMSVPLINAVKNEFDDSKLVILDGPPGTSCPLVSTISDVDYTLLVTEATPFGLHDLKLAVGVLRKLKMPFGVIINRADIGDKNTEKWCKKEDITLHLQIPFDREIAAGYAAGQQLFTQRPELQASFLSLLTEIKP